MGDRLEERKDFTAEVTAKLPEAKKLAEGGKLADGLDIIMSLERLCRVGNDFPNLKEVILTAARLCRQVGDWAQLNTTLTLISKRRGQHSKAVTAMVQEAVGWLDETPDKDTRVLLLVALRDITDGKIYVEAERAKLTRMLAKIKEEDGDVAGAAEVLQEVHVETYGALTKKEKADFILEQIRLTLAKKDFVRALIQSRKINRKVLLDEDMQDIKVRFYKLMIEYDTHEKATFDLCQDFHSIYDTPLVRDREGEEWKQYLQAAVLFLVLSPNDNHQQDMLFRVAEYKKLEELPAYKMLVKLFTTPEIIGYPVENQEVLESDPCLAAGGPELLTKWKEDLKLRIVQHNIRTVASYYKQINTKRLADLLGLDENQAERKVADMVSDGSLAYAKIDRPKGIINFDKRKPSEEILSEWNSDIGQLLQLVERSCHLINKENMLHKIE
ncbi:unnamed protein product [Ectocarpus sp. 12 AP-2014]